MRALLAAVALASVCFALLLLTLFAADVGGWTRFGCALVLTAIGTWYLVRALTAEPEPEPRQRDRWLP